VAKKPLPETLSDTPAERVVMGRVAAPYAVQGWLKIQPYTESVDGLLEYPAWWLGLDTGPKAGWSKYPLLEGKVHGQTLLVRLDGVPDRTAAERLKGVEVAIERSLLPVAGKDEYYWDDLVGLDVMNAQGVSLGKVVGLLETGAHDVLRVVGDRERLIPFVAVYVMSVDKAAGRIQVEWGADWDQD